MNTPERDASLAVAFPAPGPLIEAAYLDLYLAVEGEDLDQDAVGDPDLLPRPWDPPTCRDPELRAELWDWLDAVVIWLNHEYVWDPTGMIPPCWPQHPHLVHEIAVLADQRRRAGTALDSNALEEWHRYSLPGFHERMRGRLKTHCEQDHQPWPARSRHLRHTAQPHTAARSHLYEMDAQRFEPRSPALPTALSRPALRNTGARPLEPNTE